MVSFFAVAGREVYPGGFAQCVTWARERIKTDPAPVQILKARAGERDARVVAEIAPDGERLIAGGRLVPLSKLRKALL